MSVLIPKRKLPKNCYECGQSVRDTRCGDTCNLTGHYIEEHGHDRPDWCPLIEVVHCRDCKNAQFDALFCDYWCDGGKVKGDDFCSRGVKK